MHVRIVEKKNQKEGITTDGIVARILTNSSEHPHGIKVQLGNGVVGRVKEIISMGWPPKDKTVKKEWWNFAIARKRLNAAVEFEPSFRFDLRRFEPTGAKKRIKKLKRSISKVVASFMNAEGGYIFGLGSHHAKVLGIDEDLALPDKQNLDTFRLQVRISLERYLCNKTTYEHITIEVVVDVEIRNIHVMHACYPISWTYISSCWMKARLLG
jgi:uncharacterized repeat protein (TIGR03833 family)